MSSTCPDQGLGWNEPLHPSSLHPLSATTQSSPPPNRPSSFTYSIYLCLHPLTHPEKAMAPHSSTLAWKSHGQRSLVGCSPWGHKESDMTEQLHFQFSLSTFMHWRRKWQPTPVFLPGESQGWQSLVGCRLWGRTESDTTEAT